MTVGIVSSAAAALRLRQGFPSYWTVTTMCNPGDVPARVGLCHVVVFAPDVPSQEYEEQLAAVERYVMPLRLPTLVYGSLRTANAWFVRRHLSPNVKLAIPRIDDAHIPDLVLGCALRLRLNEVAAAVRLSTDANPCLVETLAELVANGVRSFREAASLMTEGEVPFVRRVQDLGHAGPNRNQLQQAAAAADINLRDFLYRNAMLQAVMRYVPDRSYQLAVRLNYKSDNSFRMALRRGIGVGLKEVHTVRVEPLVDWLMETVHSG